MKAIFLLVLPLLELCWLQEVFARAQITHSLLADVGVPILLLLGLALWRLHERGALPGLAFQPVAALAHGALVYATAQALEMPALALGLLTPLLLSSLAVLVPLRVWWRTPEMRAVGGAVALLGWAPWLAHGYWEPMASQAGETARGALRACGLAVESRWCGGHFVLERAGFAVALTDGCAGVHGLVYFTFLFSTLQLLGILPSTRWRLALAALSGAAGILALNVLRIALFLVWGAWLNLRIADGARAKQWILALHANLGWALYALGLGLFFLAWAQRPRAQTV